VSKSTGLFIALFAALSSGVVPAAEMADVKVNSLREAYYGDLHLHTSYSTDVHMLGGTSVDPDTAYRFAKGERIRYLGEEIQRAVPLDFLAVTDHSENLGAFAGLDDPNSRVSRSDAGKQVKEVGQALSRRDMRHFWEAWIDFFVGSQNRLPADLKRLSDAAWKRTIEAANRHYEPGRFTTFIGYEWTAMPFGANLHRNVIFRGDRAPSPFTAFDSKFPEDLWAWLGAMRKKGFEAIAIPHNPNASNGLMYGWSDSYTALIGPRYALMRQMNEPLSEISQIKGTSETHPLLSTTDEFANYEIFDFLEAARGYPGRAQGSYLRDALGRGLVLQQRGGVNPYKYGFVGGSDLHGGMTVSDQKDFWGEHSKVNLGGGKPTHAEAATLLSETRAVKQTAGSLTGVWAESNTRESIFDALRRRETFATTGSRLRIRFFGGWALDNVVLDDSGWVAAAYAAGVPMGGDLPPRPEGARAPSFVIWAAKDPNGANLDRIQVIKVWEEGGQPKEKVFDVVWAGDRARDAATGKVPSVGSTVDLKTGEYTNDIGAAELRAVWRDPDFDSSGAAAYYLRVLEIPTPRWSTLLALERGLPIPENVAAVVQLRGWSSPIWFTPAKSE